MKDGLIILFQVDMLRSIFERWQNYALYNYEMKTFKSLLFSCAIVLSKSAFLVKDLFSSSLSSFSSPSSRAGISFNGVKNNSEVEKCLA